MPLTRWIISSRDTEGTPVKNAVVNTLYFNVSGSVDEPDYETLGNDLWTIWVARTWVTGRFVDIRGYNMDDPEPRPQKFIRRGVAPGTRAEGVPQLAVCLSYYADRNLPRQRGRIFCGPMPGGYASVPTTTTTRVLELAPAFAGLGGVNVDWSLWSPTTQTHTRINHAWVDDSWDIIRSRKIAAVGPRKTWEGNG